VARPSPAIRGGPPEKGDPGQAARLLRATAAVSNRTDIRLETPDSSIVTP
jgi:hypothetical protein